MSHEADFYELAYARYQAPAYTPLIKASKTHGSPGPVVRRFSDRPRRVCPGFGSRNAEASGYAILQQGEGPRATWLCLKYGPHGGGHGHFDKNHFVLYAGGEPMMPDTGSHAYASSLHRDWDKTSFAHNTLVVDQATQARSTGKCLCFGSAEGVDYAMTDAGPIYEGVRFVRTAAMVQPDLVVVIDYVHADKPRTLDLVCHHHGTWENLPAGKSIALPDAAGYKCVNDATTRSGDAGVSLVVKRDGDRTSQIILAGNGPTEVITGTGVGSTTEHRVPVAVFRRVAKETVYAWAVSLKGTPVSLSTEVAGGATTVLVKASVGNWRLTPDPNAGTVKIARP